MIKAALDVRPSTPNSIVLVESGLLPIKAIVYARQWQFYKRFMDDLNGIRLDMMNNLLRQPSSYVKHYENLVSTYHSKEEIYSSFRLQNEEIVKSNANNSRYKFQIYMDINPDLKPSPYINSCNPVAKYITRLRLGSHLLPIETGRWTRTPRNERICRNCNVLGDERHYLYDCSLIDRNNMLLPQPLSNIWDSEYIFILITEMLKADLL